MSKSRTMIKVLNRKALTSAGGWIGSSPENLSIKKYELKLKKSDPTKSTVSLKFSLHNHANIFNQLQAGPDKHKLSTQFFDTNCLVNNGSRVTEVHMGN